MIKDIVGVRRGEVRLETDLMIFASLAQPVQEKLAYFPLHHSSLQQSDVISVGF